MSLIIIWKKLITNLSLHCYIMYVDWSCLYRKSNTNEAIDFFYSKMFVIIHTHIYQILVSTDTSCPLVLTWTSWVIIKEDRKKNVVHRKFKNSDNTKDRLHFCYLRALCKKKSRSWYPQYLLLVSNKGMTDR